MPTIEAEFEVYCTCGNGLCGNTTTSKSTLGGPAIEVEPCEKCLSRANDEGYEEGLKEAEEE